MVITIPPPPVTVPEMEATSSCSAVGDSVLSAAKDARAVADAAGDGAQSLTWEGMAAEAANHAMTALTNGIGDAASALWAVVPELDAYAEAITDLEARHGELVTLRSQLVSDRDGLVSDVNANDDPGSSLWLQLRATALTVSIEAFGISVQDLSTELTAAEDAVIAALQAGDTAAEAREFRAARPPELQDAVDALVESGVLPEEMRFSSAAELQAWLEANPAAAGALVDGGAPIVGDATTLEQLVASGATIEDIGAVFTGMSGEELALLATLYPSLMGNTNGVPFDARALANRVTIIDALADERVLLEEMGAQHEHHQSDWDWFGANNDTLEGPLADTENRISLYESILNGDRTILFFEPATHDADFTRTYDGAIAELHGAISADTQNVGVLVPGTGSHLGNFNGTAGHADEFQAAAGDGTAMISWMGGDFPNDVAAANSRHSVDLGPRLADFSEAVRQETGRVGADGATTTYLGHSYGGAVVGLAETHGLDADRVVHVESAGTGHDVFSPSDLPASQQDVQRFSMTAPYDPISAAQGIQSSEESLGVTDYGLGHGADPDEFDGVVRLHTGDYANGEPLTGLPAHSDVFDKGSDAWTNMLGVIVGGEVETYRTPITDEGAGIGGIDPVLGWNDDGTTYDVGAG
ncbi:alpha/beta hydrolase [Serinibacter arcticus]|uniref:DUF1023 domain-containing protein n=1 Tax=Serinibacter arcticus TaxID=1655435 RepID=A0A4Z1DZN2_9MICO|nr:alpha/beta hydrolase [Serinibacter arcticus]TGO05125.1 protein of unknown function DUF1023 [Serinibacter arcticus]